MYRISNILFVFILFIKGCSRPHEGRIVKVIDGGTYVFQTIKGSYVVRMQGIDAPDRDQPFSRESVEFLKRYLYKPAITITHCYDRYKRALGTLYIDSININLLSIKGGFSWYYKRYFSAREYAKAENCLIMRILPIF